MMLDDFEEREFVGATVEDAVNRACDYFNIMEKRLVYRVTKSLTRGILKNKKIVTIVARPAREDEKKEAAAPSADFDEGYIKYMLDLNNKFVSILKMDLKQENIEDKGRFVINLSGPDRLFLLHNNAELLEAMQFILNKIGMKHEKYQKILLDSNGFRDEKEHQLIQLAHSTAMKVKKMNKSFTLDPLNSYERRIIHMALADDREVITKSLGEGNLKRISISKAR